MLLELSRMLENAIDARKKREELKAKRNLLFQRFLKNPHNIRMALRINRIDDRIAEFTEQMEQKRAGRN